MLCPHCLDAELWLDNRDPHEIESVYCPKCGHREYLPYEDEKIPLELHNMKLFKKDKRIKKVRIHIQEINDESKPKKARSFTVHDTTVEEMAALVENAIEAEERKKS